MTTNQRHPHAHSITHLYFDWKLVSIKLQPSSSTKASASNAAGRSGSIEMIH